MMPQRVAVLTTTRADYGLLHWVLREIEARDDLELLLYVTGSHLVPEFGYTVRQIESDGFNVARKVEILLAADTPTAAAKAMSLAMAAFADCLAIDRPALTLVLGDRFEIVPVALAAVLLNIPVAHIHGGESSTGALDDYFRHAITKLATLHFASTDLYRRRILQMGEAAENVFDFGAPGLDHLQRTPLLERGALQDRLGLNLDRRTALVTYHPVTAAFGAAGEQIAALLAAIEGTLGLQAVFTAANADAEGRLINEKLRDFCRRDPTRYRFFENLGTPAYLSCLRHLDLMIGNSSSGIIEAPSFELPVVNIGDRQRGRVTARNVLHCGYSESDVRNALEQALAPGYRTSLAGLENPYDRDRDGRISARIVGAVAAFVRRPRGVGKKFVDLADRP